MRKFRALAWLACVGACAGHLTKPSARAAEQDAVDAPVSTAGDVSSGKATDARKSMPQTITSEAAAFDDKGLSGSTARNAAAEMVKSRLATQTTRPVFEQGFAGPRRRLSGGTFAPTVTSALPTTIFGSVYVLEGFGLGDMSFHFQWVRRRERALSQSWG